jgi:hypothetical protein
MCGTDGDGGPALLAKIAYPGHMVMSRTGDLYVAESQGLRVRILSGACDDSDGLTSAEEAALGTHACNPDTDGDGCPDGREVGSNQLQGGGRDPTNHWDYFNPQLDGVNRIADISLVVSRYGHDDNGDPLYSVNYDRTALVGGNPWQFGPPNGTIRIPDINAAVLSYGHDCS